MHQASCPYKPQQNARVERRHRYILEMTRALRFQSGLDTTYCGDCVLTSVYIMNRLPSSVLQNKSPYEVLYNEAPNYDDLKAFGCLAFAANPSMSTDKLEARGVACIFLGYPLFQKGYRLMDLSTKSLFVSRDVIFKESVFPYNASDSSTYLNLVPVTVPIASTNTQSFVVDFDFDYDHSILADNEATNTGHTAENNPTESDNSVEYSVWRSTTLRKPPVWMDSYSSNSVMSNVQTVLAVINQEVASNFHCFLTSVTTNLDPTSYKQAVKSSHWIQAMNIELEALERNGTWVITELPAGKQAIGCKWIYKTKYKPDGTIDRFKSRLVILGCRQIQGIDYGETFAPVAKMATVRTLLAVAAIQNWVTHQMDVTNAFLHGDLDEEVYMELPQGYTGWGSRITTESLLTSVTRKAAATRLVCKLVKSLYGLKQAPRCWFSKLSATLKEDGFSQSKADYSLFTKVTKITITLILVYVDDLLLAGSSIDKINELRSMLSHNFHMKDLGEIRYFLGLEVHRYANGFFISQKKYVMDLLKEYHITAVTPSKLPMETHLKLTPEKGEPLADVQPY